MNILKEKIKLQVAVPGWKRILRKMKSDQNKKIILIGTPVHGNLGDHAIAIEERNFFKDNFDDYHVYEIYMPMYHLKKDEIHDAISPRDIIFISGGGWMGNLWLHNEEVIREVVATYPNNQIVIFPQTIFYTQDEAGERECKKTSEIFAHHKNLLFYLREKKSYDLVRDKFFLMGNSKAYLCPDMVLYGGNSPVKGLHRKNVINVCIREDREAIIDDYSGLVESLEGDYKIVKLSTVVSHIIPPRNREKELYKVWNLFGDAAVTVTDRLHAMLFSVLNGTPCIALDNKTGKVFGVASWINNTGMIILVDSLEEAIKQLKIVNEKNEFESYNRENLKIYFEQMVSDIRKGSIG
ncbi:MAG: polysaccharide pyruvyl transferase family protein [Roseburia sp.]|nr:polysaccharide pyruvyl transferase family protein [Roseburia sp.]